MNRSIAVKLGDGVKRQLKFQGPLLYGPFTKCGNSIYHSENSIYHSDFGRSAPSGCSRASRKASSKRPESAARAT